MLGTFIDAIVICTMTGLSIVIAGTWNIGLEGVAVTAKAFQLTLPFPEQFSSFILMICRCRLEKVFVYKREKVQCDGCGLVLEPVESNTLDF